MNLCSSTPGYRQAVSVQVIKSYKIQKKHYYLLLSSVPSNIKKNNNKKDNVDKFIRTLHRTEQKESIIKLLPKNS